MEIIVPNDKFEEIINRLSEVKLTKEFMEECNEVAAKYKKSTVTE